MPLTTYGGVFLFAPPGGRIVDLFEDKRDQPDLDGEASAVMRMDRTPLAERMRPKTLDEVVGQEHLLAPGKLLRRAIEADRLTSLILYGPPGCGRPSRRAVLSKASPGASSMVPPSRVKSSVPRTSRNWQCPPDTSSMR